MQRRSSAWTLAIVSIALFMTALDNLVVGVALPSIRADFGGSLEALQWTAARPGKGIVRNALLFASAFSVMLFAPLTPYVTVGAFIVSMMTLSAVTTILYLPALVVLLRGWLFQRGVA